MLLFKNTALTSLVVLTCGFGLFGCSSVQDTPNQQIEFVTPGAQNARCDVHIGNSIYQAYPPQRITVKNSGEAMTVNCFAPGNRERTVMLEPEISKSTYGNVVTLGVGAAYDFASGAMFMYPDQVAVDFTRVFPRPNLLPNYHSPDGVVPRYEHGIEHTGPKILETRTSIDLKARTAWINEREHRKASTEFGVKGKSISSNGEYKGYQGSSDIPRLVSPYFPQSNFQGSTSF